MTRILSVAAALLVAGCSSAEPVAVHAGDTWFRCHRIITNAKLAGEIIDASGLAYKFRGPLCTAQYLAEHEARPRAVYVTDWTTGMLVRAETATFVRTTIDPQTNERDYVAFRSLDNALDFARKNLTSLVDWLVVMQVAAAKAAE